MTTTRSSGTRVILAGATAGLAATVPMTIAMELMHRQLPRRQRYPLPPRIITERVAGKAGMRGAMDEDQRIVAALAAHFAYGTATGAIYGAIADGVDAQPVV